MKKNIWKRILAVAMAVVLAMTVGTALLGCDSNPDEKSKDRKLGNLYSGFEISKGFEVKMTGSGKITTVYTAEAGDTFDNGSSTKEETSNLTASQSTKIKMDGNFLYMDLNTDFETGDPAGDLLGGMTQLLGTNAAIYLRGTDLYMGVDPEIMGVPSTEEMIYIKNPAEVAMITPILEVLPQIFGTNMGKFNAISTAILEDMGKLVELVGEDGTKNGYTLEIDFVKIITDFFAKLGDEINKLTNKTTIGNLYKNLGIQGFLKEHFGNVSGEEFYQPIKGLIETIYPIITGMAGSQTPELTNDDLLIGGGIGSMPEDLELPATFDELLVSMGMEPMGDKSLYAYIDSMIEPFKKTKVVELINSFMGSDAQLTPDVIKGMFQMILPSISEIFEGISLKFILTTDANGVLNSMTMTADVTSEDTYVYTGADGVEHYGTQSNRIQFSESVEFKYESIQFVDVAQLPLTTIPEPTPEV